jgi:hypothetical protein
MIGRGPQIDRPTLPKNIDEVVTSPMLKSMVANGTASRNSGGADMTRLYGRAGAADMHEVRSNLNVGCLKVRQLSGIQAYLYLQPLQPLLVLPQHLYEAFLATDAGNSYGTSVC